MYTKSSRVLITTIGGPSHAATKRQVLPVTLCIVFLLPGNQYNGGYFRLKEMTGPREYVQSEPDRDRSYMTCGEFTRPIYSRR